MKWFYRALVVALVAGLAWLYFSPPVVTLDSTGAAISCEPLGFETPGTISPLSSPLALDDIINQYLESDELIDDDSTAEQRADAYNRARADIAAGCSDARESRQASLIVGSAAVLGLLIWRRTAVSTPTPVTPKEI